ncbi:hypothetical protein ACQKL0_01830 [Peribacillus sp. NPDC097264]|uniref:hypothetical protein n=1 Tax=unclassified Peribacillus TaxID=2675266 RepID=UPI003800CE07
MMKKRLYALIGGSLMSAMFLAGCGNDDDNNPAPENDNMIEENQNDGVDDNGGTGNDNNNLDTDNDGMIENDDTMNGDDNNNTTNNNNDSDDLIEDAEKKGKDNK